MAFRRRDMRLAGGEAELNGPFARGSSRPGELPNRKLTFRVHCISLTEHRRQEFRQISLVIERVFCYHSLEIGQSLWFARGAEMHPKVSCSACMSIGWVRALLFSAVVAWSIPALAASVSITQQPQSQTIRQGSNVTFTVTATGTVPLSYQWVFNATNNLSAATNSSLTLTNVQAASQGGYAVVVGDVSGSVTSHVATLTVLVLPVIVVQPQSLTVVEGEDAIFSVAVTNDATLPVNYQWRKSSTPLTNLLLNATTCSFTMYNVQTNVTSTNGPGNYRVAISNAATLINLIGSPLVTLTVISPILPELITEAASDVSGDGATLNGSINPEGSTTLAWFEYGLTPSYGGSTDPIGMGRGTNFIPVTVAVPGLLPGTTYHFRIVASNRAGLTNGPDQTFVSDGTSVPPPEAITLPPSSITIASAILNGGVNPHGGYSTAFFEYGLAVDYGNRIALADVPHGPGPITVSEAAPGLTAGTVYHYRLVAFNYAGTNFGGDQSFQTQPPPDVQTFPAILANNPDVVLQGSVNPNGSSNTVYFEYGLTTDYGSSTAPIDMGDGTNSVVVSNIVSGLLGYTNHHYRIAAVNAAGTNYGMDQSFILAVPEPYEFTTFAGRGGGFGSSDGVGTAAGFHYPDGVDVDADGNIYVADSSNHTIRKITPAGLVTTLAGLAGNSGCADGIGSVARFYEPEGVAVDSSGNVYVADSFNNTVRKITPNGSVSTLAGLPRAIGSADGLGSAARFNDPRGVAVDANGFIYIADSGNLIIRKITPAGQVSTLAGLAGVGGSADGAGSAARFGTNSSYGRTGPIGVTVDPFYNVYVADTYNSTIREISPAGVVTTLAGLAGNNGFANGVGSAARFFYPGQVAADRFGNVYVADTDTQTIRKIAPDGTVSTFAGLFYQNGSTDGAITDAQFAYPHGVAVDKDLNVYVADTVNNTIRKVAPGGPVSTLAGRLSNPGNVDAQGGSARFNTPQGVAVDTNGVVFVADSYNSEIRKITPDGMVTTLAGRGFGGTNDGTGTGAQFWRPSSVAVGQAGTLYVADTWNQTIRKVTPGGVVTTFAGSPGILGSQDGQGANAQFYYPGGIAVDADGNVYVADTDNCTIRKITPGGVVSTFAGVAGSRGNADGIGSEARFWYPYAVAVDLAGNLYVADSQNSTIRKITPDGLVSTVAGVPYYGVPDNPNDDGTGSNDGIGSGARFYGPTGVTVDSAGNIYVTDTGNETIRQMTPSGVVTTIGGLPGSIGSEDGTGSEARFNDPAGIAVDRAGEIYIADAAGNTIRHGKRARIFITRQPSSQTVFEGGVAGFIVEASSTLPLSYQWRFNGANLPNATNSSLTLSNIISGQAGNYTVVISNSSASVTSRVAILTVVTGAPSLNISLQPQSQTVSAGTTVTLKVTASGNPPPVYQWRRNGVDIPGAVGPSLTLPNAQATDGGRYNVVVASLAGVITSDPADMVVSSPSLPFADNFVGGLINSAAGFGSGSNTLATMEAGETNHFGKAGGKSVWLKWQAPAAGIATFTTLGSSFDTLLAVYTGSSVTNLTEVASDDDRAGFLNSQATFKANSGGLYAVVVDGFSGASGNIVLSWSLDTTITDLPRFLVQPLSQTVTNGATMSNHVSVASLTTVRYQWYYNCEPILVARNPTAATATLVISNVQPAAVGSYTVEVYNNSFHTVESLPAFLEIGPQPDGRSQDKMENLFPPAAVAHAVAGFSRAIPAATAGGSTFISVSAGTLDSQVLNNFGAATQQGEPNFCGVLGGSSKWLGLQPAADGVMVVDTMGSAIDTVLAVYTGTNILTLSLVACDNNGAPDGIRSLVRFPATSGIKYSVAMDGVNGAQGNINLNWQLATRWRGVAQPTNANIHAGGNLVLGISVSDTLPTPAIQWFLNGRNLPGATSLSYRLENIQPAQAGTYSVVVSNLAAAVTSVVATVTVTMPIHLSYQVSQPNGVLQFRLTAPSGEGLLVESSPDLRNWVPRYTNSTTSGPLNFLDAPGANAPLRFYRARQWP